MVARSKTITFEEVDGAWTLKSTVDDDVHKMIMSMVAGHPTTLRGGGNTQLMVDLLETLGFRLEVADGDTTSVPVIPPGYSHTWGAAFGESDTGDYAVPNGRADGGETTGLGERSEYLIPCAGTITRFSYQTQSGTADTVWKIVVNGDVEATITQSAAVGIATVSVPVVEGDLVAIEYDAGTVPNRSLLGVFVT